MCVIESSPFFFMDSSNDSTSWHFPRGSRTNSRADDPEKKFFESVRREKSAHI